MLRGSCLFNGSLVWGAESAQPWFYFFFTSDILCIILFWPCCICWVICVIICIIICCCCFAESAWAAIIAFNNSALFSQGCSSDSFFIILQAVSIWSLVQPPPRWQPRFNRFEPRLKFWKKADVNGQRLKVKLKILFHKLCTTVNIEKKTPVIKKTQRCK